MRAQSIAIAMVLLLAPAFARELRAAQQSCPRDMVDIFKRLGKENWIKEDVAKECAKRSKPNCYADCTCFLSESLFILIAFAAKETGNKMTGDALVDACTDPAAKHGINPVTPKWVVEYASKNDCFNYLEKSGENAKCLKKIMG